MNYTKISRAASLRSARITADIQELINKRSYYQFQYTPLTGPLPGLSFEQQTEDAINDIGNKSYGSYEIATQALTTANQAYNAAQSAIEIANHAETTAQNAQTTADNAVIAANNAQDTADNAAAAARNAQDTADTAVKDAEAAQQTADNAQNSANSAIETATAAQSTADKAQIDATTALSQIEVLTPIVDELRYYDNITDAVDLNIKTEFARELLEASGNINVPENGIGWLDVDDDFNEIYIRQKFLSQASGKSYVRFGTIVPDSDPIEISSWSAWIEYAIKSDLDSTTADLTAQINTVATNLATHEADYDNPHKVTAEQLGLANSYVYRGTVKTYADLPTTGQKNGDVYNVETADPDHGISAGDNVAWDGEKWDILGGNHDLSAYATLAGNNTWTGINTYNNGVNIFSLAGLTVKDNISSGQSAGTINLGSPAPNTDKIQVKITALANGNVNYYAGSDVVKHRFYCGTTNCVDIGMAGTNPQITFGATFPFATYYNDNTQYGIKVTNLLAPTADTDAANKKYVDDAVQGSGGGDVTAAGNNTFTGTNIYRKPVTIANDDTAGAIGLLYLGTKNDASTYSPWIRASGGGIDIQTSEETPATFRVMTGDQRGLGVFKNVIDFGEDTSSNTSTITLRALNQKFIDYSINNGLRIFSNDFLTLTPQNGTDSGVLKLLNSGEMQYQGQFLKLTTATGKTTCGVKWGDYPILQYDNTNKKVALNGTNTTTSVEIGTQIDNWAIQIPDTTGLVNIKKDLTIGNTTETSGVIRAGNTENCLYFTGTAENTYFSRPGSDMVVSYQTSCNCYLIDAVTNNPASFTINASKIAFHATVGSNPYMQKTLTYTISVGATVPVVTWAFPSGATVYYPSGTAPTLTANANNIINVIVFVDDTDSYIVQVCDTVAIPMA